MNDSYYEPVHDRAWDALVDYCDENDLNTDEEDFEAWVEDQREAAEEARAERIAEARKEGWDY